MSQNTARYREVLCDFINIYRNEPCLWQIKNKLYHSRDKRNAALDKLVAKYKEVEESADRETVLKKINSLRTNYKKEKKKVENSKRSGAGADVIFEPKLWYFKELIFLDDQIDPRTSCSNINDEVEDLRDERDEEEESTDAEINQDNSLQTQLNEQNVTDDNTSSNKTSRPTPRKKNDRDLINSVLQSVNDHFKRPRDEIKQEDRHDIYCKSIASKLRDLPRKQRMLAEKLINEVLFEAEWGNLTLDFKLINIGHTDNRYSPSSSTNFSAAYQYSPPGHSLHQTIQNSIPSSNIQHQTIPTPSSPNMQRPTTPSYQVLYSNNSSYTNSNPIISQNMQNQMNPSPIPSQSLPIQNDDPPTVLLSIPENSAASFITNFRI
ncbi:unnamed protein product [Parnassius mnemosyne]|uniref:MADF domain-containing protein n=1 Tax=Parnassius mnemosyne TaxID=213953 RepID=A0AAV1LPF4_9NEOP